MNQSRAVRTPVLPVVWSVVLGVVGFGRGFFGPIVVRSGSNLGPRLRVFFGPRGFVAGLILGCMVVNLNWNRRRHTCLLCATSLLFAGCVLYMCLPDPSYRGTVIDGEIRACRSPAPLVPDAIEQWEREVRNRPSWREVTKGWKEDIEGMRSKTDGVVLDLHVHAELVIHEHHKPWNRGEITASSWSDAGTDKSFFARYAGSSCDAYVKGERKLYFLVWEESQTWPPDKLSRILGLYVVEDVPDEYRKLISNGSADTSDARDPL